MKSIKLIRSILILSICLFAINGSLSAQVAQVINETGGARSQLDDGLKIVVNPTGALSVYRNNQTQYYNGYTYPAGAGSGVTMQLRFDNGTSYSNSDLNMTACSTSAVEQVGNNYTTSISGYIASPLSGKRFYLTINFQYTFPNTYFTVDYYVRAPFDLPGPETVHLYLSHDAFILGSDASRGYRVLDGTGEFVGDYRAAGDGTSQCINNRAKNMQSPSTHGFKIGGAGFRSYFAGPYGSRDIKGTDLRLTNTIDNNCLDDGIAVEFLVGPLSAGQIGARRVLHCYGNNMGEFNSFPVSDPIPPSGTSSPVVVNFTSSAFSEAEGSTTHAANTIKVTVSGGRLAQQQVCNFTATNGTGAQGTDYSYVKGFIIPVGNYTVPQTFTLNNFNIIGNTTCQSNKTFNISIDSEVCNDLVQPGVSNTTTVTIVDDDMPTVDQPTGGTYCNGTSVPANTWVFSGTVSGTTYEWSNNNTAIGLAASGTGNIPAFTTSNATTAPITATITVTPKQGTCSGTVKTFTITVNPTATVNVISDITACNGSTVAAIAPTSPTIGATFRWTNSNTAIGLAASGVGTIPSFTATNATTGPIFGTITVTPTFGTCDGTPRTFTITVNPTATVNAISNITACNNSTVATITPTSPTVGATFRWTNSNTAIGLAASGTGSVPSFTATNTTTGPIFGTITVTPVYGTCDGTSRTFTITVNPTATVNAISNVTACNNSTVATITPSSPTAGATFRWTNSNTTIGLAASGTGSVPSFTASNTTTAPISVIITVTPVYGTCDGTSSTFTITVNPTATVNAISNVTACNNSTVATITPTSPTTGATFRWTNSNPAIGLAASGTGTVPSFTATNTTTAPIFGTITVTPVYGTCDGTSRTFTITVNPTATVNAISNITACYNTTVASVSPSSPTSGATFTWTNSNTAIGLSASGSGAIPSFTSANTGTSPITATIRVTPSYGSCTGTFRDFTITVNPRLLPGSISGNPYVYTGQSAMPIIGTASTGGSGSFTYQWQSSSTGTGSWSNISGANQRDYSPGVLTATTYFRRLTIDALCETVNSNTFKITLMTSRVAMYWKESAPDNNWNNPANWLDFNGQPMTDMVPLVNADVHIPGNATNYPSLDVISTPRAGYGEPTCGSITFRFGGQIAYPHKLKYDKAYVQYNWGYYNNLPGGCSYASQPTQNMDAAYPGAVSPKAPLKRDAWYTLSAPLKKIASGDFAVAGNPVTWQSLFNMSNPVTGEFIVADFCKPFASNDVDLNCTHNAVAIKVSSYDNKVGKTDQRCMEDMKGIIEFPYFEKSGYPGHSYNPIRKESTFYFFDATTLQKVESRTGKMQRGNEAYRFVYEDNSKQAPSIVVRGETVPGYKITVSIPAGCTSHKVMVGNPFMSSINAQKFFDANNTTINQVEGYQIYANPTWSTKTFSAGNNIAPLQAFVVTLANSQTSAEIFFPLEGTYALTGSAFRGVLQSPAMPQLLMSSTLEGVDPAEVDPATLVAESGALEGAAANVRKMIYAEEHNVPETFFISKDRNAYNLIQLYEEGVNELGIGVRSSNSTQLIKLQFDNVDAFVQQTHVYPVLLDRLLNKRQDLLSENTYSFYQRPEVSAKDSLYADTDRFALLFSPTTNTSIGSEEADYLRISSFGQQLTVSASHELDQIQMYDGQGRRVASWNNLTSPFYSQKMELPAGIYIVKALTKNGLQGTQKITVH